MEERFQSNSRHFLFVEGLKYTTEKRDLKDCVYICNERRQRKREIFFFFVCLAFSRLLSVLGSWRGSRSLLKASKRDFFCPKAKDPKGIFHIYIASSALDTMRLLSWEIVRNFFFFIILGFWFLRYYLGKCNGNWDFLFCFQWFNVPILVCAGVYFLGRLVHEVNITCCQKIIIIIESYKLVKVVSIYSVFFFLILLWFSCNYLN